MDKDDNMDMGGGMIMYLYFGLPATEILFKSWTVKSVGALIGSMAGIFLIAVLYEGLKALRTYAFQKMAKSQKSIENGVKVVSGNGGNLTITTEHTKQTPFSWQHVLQTILHMVQLAVAYALMLIVMTYNAWLFLAVVFGSGVGYFIFGWRVRSVADENEHCQ